jgi:iron complex transport system substrate-binding protein
MIFKRITALFLSLLMVTLAAGCAAPALKAPASPATVTVTDMSGRTITIDKPVERIVVLTASDCEIVYALGAGGLVVGRGEYCDYPEEVLAVTAVKSGSDTNIEQVIALKPDIIIMSQMAQTPEHVASFEAAGIKVVQTYAQNIEDIYTAITIIGQLLGKNDEAKAVVDDMKKTSTI